MACKQRSYPGPVTESHSSSFSSFSSSSPTVARTQQPPCTLAQVQQQAKCVIGVDYPEPMVDHNTAKEENLKRMAEAYAAAKKPAKKKASSPNRKARKTASPSSKANAEGPSRSKRVKTAQLSAVKGTKRRTITSAPKEPKQETD